MPSVRKLRRRLLRWERYAVKTGGWRRLHPATNAPGTLGGTRLLDGTPQPAGVLLCIGIRIDRL